MNFEREAVTALIILAMLSRYRKSLATFMTRRVLNILIVLTAEATEAPCKKISSAILKITTAASK